MPEPCRTLLTHVAELHIMLAYSCRDPGKVEAKTRPVQKAHMERLVPVRVLYVSGILCYFCSKDWFLRRLIVRGILALAPCVTACSLSYKYS